MPSERTAPRDQSLTLRADLPAALEAGFDSPLLVSTTPAPALGTETEPRPTVSPASPPQPNGLIEARGDRPTATRPTKTRREDRNVGINDTMLALDVMRISYVHGDLNSERAAFQFVAGLYPTAIVTVKIEPLDRSGTGRSSKS